MKVATTLMRLLRPMASAGNVNNSCCWSLAARATSNASGHSAARCTVRLAGRAPHHKQRPSKAECSAPLYHPSKKPRRQKPDLASFRHSGRPQHGTCEFNRSFQVCWWCPCQLGQRFRAPTLFQMLDGRDNMMAFPVLDVMNFNQRGGIHLTR